MDNPYNLYTSRVGIVGHKPAFQPGTSQTQVRSAVVTRKLSLIFSYTDVDENETQAGGCRHKTLHTRALGNIAGPVATCLYNDFLTVIQILT